MNQPRANAAGAVIDNLLYVVGGATRNPGHGTADIVHTQSLEAYDPARNTWSNLAPLPTARHGLGAAVLGGKLYAVGGNTNDTLAGATGALEVFLPGTNQWRKLSPLPTPRWQVAAAGLDGLLYAIGGQNGSNCLPVMEVYDPATNTWLTRNPRTGTPWAALPEPVTSAAAMALGDKVYVAGGFQYPDRRIPKHQQIRLLQVYDPQTNTWQRQASMAVPRAGHAAATMQGLLYVVGGGNDLGIPANSIEVYDPSTNTWRILASAGAITNRNSFVLGAIGDRLYVAGGHVGRRNWSGSLEAYLALPAEDKAVPAQEQRISIKLWGTATEHFQASVLTRPPALSPATGLSFSQDGSRMAVVIAKRLTIRETAGDRYLVLERDDADRIAVTAFSPDGKQLVSGHSDGTIKLWDVGTGRLRAAWKGHLQGVTSVAFSPDGSRLVSGSWDRTARLWDVAARILLREFSGHLTAVRSVVFSPDGTRIASAADSVRVWEAATGRLQLTMKEAGADIYNTVAWSPDGDRLAAGGDDAVIGIWDVLAGALKTKLEGHSGPVLSLVFHPGGGRLAAGSGDGTATLWDVAAGRLVATLRGHVQDLHTLAFILGGKRLVSVSGDGALKLWDAETAAELFTLLFIRQADWVAFAPDGRFDTSAEGYQYVSWAIQDKTYDFRQFRELFYLPGLWPFLWSDLSLPAVSRDLRAGVAPAPEVRILRPADGVIVDRDEVQVDVEVTDMGGGTSDLRCYHNGKLVSQTGRRGVLLPPADTRTCLVMLVEGDNEIRVTAFSVDGIEARRPATIKIRRQGIAAAVALQKRLALYRELARLKTGTKRHQELSRMLGRTGITGDLWVLAVGINRYQDSALNLQYARHDAEAFVASTRQRARGLVRRIRTRTLYDGQATRANLQSALDWLRASKPRDTVVIYLAGHGRTTPEGMYAYLPQEFATEMTASGITVDDWSRALTQVPARQVFMVLDTCKSGALVPTQELQRRASLARLNMFAGITVLAASTTQQHALEESRLKHGVFTYSLLRGINGEAADRTGIVSVLGLAAYVEYKVPELTEVLFKQKQQPVHFSSGHNFAIGVVL